MKRIYFTFSVVALLLSSTALPLAAGNITFADAVVKAICVENWDTDGDGELSMEEAAAVTDLENVFRGSVISSFNELQYFTGLTAIGEGAFEDCIDMSSVSIPNSVTSIENYAFRNCEKLSFCPMPDGLTSIGAAAFHFCSSLASISIPSNVISITANPFAYCTNLCSIIVGEGNTVFDSRDNCNAIIETETNKLRIGCKNTIIPNSVTSIDNYAFEGCSGLTSITIPSSVKTLGLGAFQNCTGLTSISIPNSITNVWSAFWGCTGFSTIIVEEGNWYLDSRGNCNAIINRSTNELILGCKNTIIPKSVTTIGYNAFDGCNLNSITIPKSVSSIEEGAFQNCPLTAVTMKKETPDIMITGDPFTNKSNTILYVPYGSKEAYEASSYWSSFKQIVEGEILSFSDANVKTLCVQNWDTDDDGELSGEEAAAVTDLGMVFRENTSITSFDELKYFTGLASIGNNAFEGCNALSSITIPNSVSVIGENSFADCDNLLIVHVENTTPIAISENTFGNRTKATLYVPAGSVPSYESANHWKEFKEIVGPIVFADENVKAICVQNWDADGDGELSMQEAAVVANIGTVFKNNSQITSFDELQYFTYLSFIEYQAFESCSNLASVVLPSEITGIWGNAFYGNSLTSITIPKKVTSISYGAFSGCPLTTVIMKNENPIKFEFSWMFVFQNKSLATLYVPAGSKTAYQGDFFWSGFGAIVETGDSNGDGEIDVNDITAIVNYIQGNALPSFLPTAADVNNDGEIDVNDITGIVNIIQQ